MMNIHKHAVYKSLRREFKNSKLGDFFYNLSLKKGVLLNGIPSKSSFGLNLKVRPLAIKFSGLIRDCYNAIMNSKLRNNGHLTSPLRWGRRTLMVGRTAPGTS